MSGKQNRSLGVVKCQYRRDDEEKKEKGEGGLSDTIFPCTIVPFLSARRARGLSGCSALKNVRLFNPFFLGGWKRHGKTY